MTISKHDFGLVAICAIRYCHGRKSYMPSLIQNICKEHIQDFTDKDLQVMLNDCDEQKRISNYGDDVIDRPGWLRWHQILLEERERRRHEQ